jgi:hypothetical protein
MFTQTLYYFLPPLIGVAVLVFGLLLLKRLKPDNPRGNMGCLGFALMILGGVIALAGLIVAPTPWERQRRLDAIFKTPPDRIERFVLTAGRPGTPDPLVKSPVVIDDDPRIKRITEILRDARPISLARPSVRWTARVDMMTDKETLTFIVRATDDGRHGTIVSVGSYPDGGGWNLGIFRADGLERIFEDAASAVGKRRSH